MDLLKQDNNPKTPPAQKMVLILLIISIILSFIIGGIIVVFSLKGETKEYTIAINGKQVALEDLSILDDINEKTYISLQKLSNALQYTYHNGEIGIVGEDTNKGYIDNKTCIVQFFANSKQIYKTQEDTNFDNQFFNLDNEIVIQNNSLYICVDDLDVALNLVTNYSKENNQTTIETPEYFVERIEESFKQANITVDKNTENLKALSYGYIIINKDDKNGVLDLNGQELIGNKYNSIIFCEYTGDFIVSNTNNKFGIITDNSIEKISLQYDSLEILNYNPLLYKVKRLEKYGIINKDGKVINEIQYDSFGYPENKNREIDYTLLVPELNENIPQSIIVCKNNKYGLIELENGNTILECNLDGIYSATDGENKYYIVEIQNRRFFLETYINNLNRITVNM